MYDKRLGAILGIVTIVLISSYIISYNLTYVSIESVDKKYEEYIQYSRNITKYINRLSALINMFKDSIVSKEPLTKTSSSLLKNYRDTLCSISYELCRIYRLYSEYKYRFFHLDGFYKAYKLLYQYRNLLNNGTNENVSTALSLMYKCGWYGSRYYVREKVDRVINYLELMIENGILEKCTTSDKYINLSCIINYSIDKELKYNISISIKWLKEFYIMYTVLHNISEDGFLSIDELEFIRDKYVNPLYTLVDKIEDFVREYDKFFLILFGTEYYSLLSSLITDYENLKASIPELDGEIECLIEYMEDNNVDKIPLDIERMYGCSDICSLIEVLGQVLPVYNYTSDINYSLSTTKFEIVSKLLRDHIDRYLGFNESDVENYTRAMYKLLYSILDEVSLKKNYTDMVIGAEYFKYTIEYGDDLDYVSIVFKRYVVKLALLRSMETCFKNNYYKIALADVGNVSELIRLLKKMRLRLLNKSSRFLIEYSNVLKSPLLVDYFLTPIYDLLEDHRQAFEHIESRLNRVLEEFEGVVDSNDTLEIKVLKLKCILGILEALEYSIENTVRRLIGAYLIAMYYIDELEKLLEDVIEYKRSFILGS